MKTSDFDYNLPEELIAQAPASERTGSRLLVLDRENQLIEHKKFPDLLNCLRQGDLLVFNNTRVIPARMYGHKEGTGGKVEILLTHGISDKVWLAMVNPGRRIKEGHTLVFGDGRLKGRVIGRKERGIRVIEFESDNFMETVEEIGITPLPPYIKKPVDDIERYQTVFARHKGSSAAPTASLHFDEEILKKIEEMGVEKTFVTLHIGPGTFLPVESDDIEDHPMHSEYFNISPETIEALKKARCEGRRIIPVGTTATRVIESVFDNNGSVLKTEGFTDIFIYPGYKFKMTDALITNFHLPKSTLIMLVSALAGREFILRAYEEAVRERYRFFSFGDCMFIH